MKKFAVFGNPIKHSISPRLHNYAIKELGLDAFYSRILLEDNIKLKEKFNTLNLDGANITIPFKEDAFKVCDHLDRYANHIGSINTLVKKNNTLYGYNTDAPGFLKAIEEFGKINSALILGAGGTAKALAYALYTKNIKADILNRSEKRKSNFKQSNFYLWDDFKIEQYDLVINSTSAGLVDEEYPVPKELLEDIFKNSSFAFDVIYNKNTPFLRLANSFKIPNKDGKDMLVYQAVLALNFFYNSNLDEKKIEIAMKKAISL
ncbi:shikimate dehydrogenase [Campylobacter blaseri]|uniref:Shikimate dehydrogenase (NADP(+)) n=1 Tax=Campylobacter blaseri TaxID=2042961 RepID=A0A2P8R1E3_9BACT|nr:shikimate dehydrogenase [Campylobacter blaseri]PSM52309.1 shikimate dehydrogenase [Campylobacter blaseri]PSM54075.1 shikimate dehydrogenase [Campylobacter blaseri]QKF85517.1 shikimate dehydrogenase [Campylobacter blaseri]